jgi:hypothetical protein
MMIVALLALTMVAPFPETFSAFQNDVVVRGTVMNWYSREPLSSAVVYAYSASGVAQTTTDRYGHFFFLTLLPGFYGFDAVKSGFHYGCPGEWLERATELSAGLQYNVTILLGPAITQNENLVMCLKPTHPAP